MTVERSTASELHRITFEFGGHSAAVTLWHHCVPKVGEKVLMSLSEWTVCKITTETIHNDGNSFVLTRYHLSGERPVTLS